MRGFVVLLVIALTACGKSEAPTPAPKSAPETAPAAAMPPEPKDFPTPDACTLLDVDSVAAVTGWKATKAVPVSTGAVYLSYCHFVDGKKTAHAVKVEVAVGSAYPENADEYAHAVGDMMGRLKAPATPVTNLGVPAIEMDGGPDAQSMQTRLPQHVELTVTSASMDVTRTLFPQALVRMRAKLPE